MNTAQLTWGGQLESCKLWIDQHASNRREVKTTTEHMAKIENAMTRLGKSGSDAFHPAMLSA